MFSVFSKNVEVDGKLVHRVGRFREIEDFLQKQCVIGNFHLYETKHQFRRLKHTHTRKHTNHNNFDPYVRII